MTEEEYKQYRREVVRRSQHKRRAKARENGLCINCCRERVVYGKTLCAVCLKKQATAQRRYMKKRIWEDAKNGD